MPRPLQRGLAMRAVLQQTSPLRAGPACGLVISGMETNVLSLGVQGAHLCGPAARRGGSRAPQEQRRLSGAGPELPDSPGAQDRRQGHRRGPLAAASVGLLP